MSTTIIMIIITVALLGIMFWHLYSSRKINNEINNITAELSTKSALLNNCNQQLAEAKQTINNCNDQINKERELHKQEIKATSDKLNAYAAENAKLLEQIRNITEEKARLQQEAESQFKVLANEIFDDKTKRFKELNETRLNEILIPLKEQILKFENTIQDNAKNDIKDREALREHIKLLMELNKTIGKEAKDLTQALKGNSKTQGDWGEMILLDILENCGLQEGIHFTVQQTTDENGHRLVSEDGQAVRPDVVVKFPQGKAIIIDSKVSLSSYVDFCSEDEPSKQKVLLDKHLVSVKRHIDELKGQKYQKAISNSADFIMMFIPNEGAYIAAMQHDNSLWKYAYDNHVVLISPTHLVSVLKLVDQLWQHDKQTKNAVRIAEETGKLYDKFAGFIDDMKVIDKSLNNTRNAYDNAMKKLTTGNGNLLKRISDIKELGAKTSKTLALNPSDE